MKTEKLKEAVYEMYRRAFAVSTPPADWDELYDNASIDAEGKRVIPFLEHECDLETMKNIVEDVIKEYKIKRRIDKSNVYMAFMLGCSPKTKVD